MSGATPTGDPILIPCEGAGCPPAGVNSVGNGICAMCGNLVVLLDNGTAPVHQRDDIIARINRGDFG